MAGTGTRRWTLAGCVALMLVAAPARADDEVLPVPPKKHYLSLAVGFPVPSGGIFGVEINKRFGNDRFANVGAATAFLLHGLYVDYGWKFGPRGFVLGGLDASLFTNPLSGELVWLPGGHLGVGLEWFSDDNRYSLSLRGGLRAFVSSQPQRVWLAVLDSCGRKGTAEHVVNP